MSSCSTAKSYLYDDDKIVIEDYGDYDVNEKGDTVLTLTQSGDKEGCAEKYFYISE